MRQSAYGPENRQDYADHVRKMTKHLAPFIRDAGEVYADYIERGFPYHDGSQNALVIDDSRWPFDVAMESKLADKSDLEAEQAKSSRYLQRAEDAEQSLAYWKRAAESAQRDAEDARRQAQRMLEQMGQKQQNKPQSD